ncbi:lateral flagellin LafA [Photobacterium lucens]|uniref:lateral flagellin LafA n=1 Tax=Photobacterium lucens TaxID=2562949 RepID=UPI00136958F5|nr:lateral flagellin LafA [Photobacterium lucens]MBP2701383.1 Lateral flagellin [Vibrio parahaemolyticus]MZG58018.1 Lateral flagellin [Photobacterium lucens]MZG79442.1 Lateral flagellin [Photobacterium lucens]
MALSMHTNYASLVTQNTLNNTSNLLNTAMERLSTGYRINSAADDAAGLQISNRLEAQTRGMSVAMRNSQDGISMLQTAEGAFDEATNILYRMNDLATQSANGTNTTADQAALDKEFTELNAELNNIVTNTKYAGDTLITGAGIKAGGVTLQIGSSSSETLDFATTIDGDVTTAHTQLATTVQALDISTTAGASGAMDALATAIDEVGAARATLGANINRLDHTITNLGNMVENTSAAKGRIMDADFAVESSSMTKNQMLMQAGTTVLSQTNQLPGMAMSLLR